MKITKPKTSINHFEFSDPNSAGTVAFFDPTIKDTRGGIAVVRENDAELIQASEDLRDNLIEAFRCIENKVDINSTNFKEIDALKAGIKSTLEKAGCEIKKS